MKKQLGILSIALAAFIAAGTAFGQPVKKAEAASLKTNIFNEEVEEDKLADNNKWVTSKKDTTIDIKNVGKDILHYTADLASGLTLMQHNNAVTLSAKQYVEFTLTFEGMLAASFVDFAFSPEKFEKGVMPDSLESVSFSLDPGWLRATLYSEVEGIKLVGGWNNEKYDPGVVGGIQWVNGNAALGCAAPARGKYALKARIYDDGTAIYFVANPYKENWYSAAVVGYVVNGTAWEKAASFAPVTEGYPTIIVRNTSEMFVGQAEIATYSYEKVFDDAGNIETGTLVGEKKVDALENSETSLFKPLIGTSDIQPSIKAIVVDNCADDDLLVKKTKLGAPKNTYAAKVYELKNELYIGAITGDAKAVMYLGGTSQKDFSDAVAFTFTQKGDNLQLNINNQIFTTSAYAEDKFTLTIVTDGEWNNTVLINGEPLKRGKNDFVFNKDISNTFIAFGTKDVSATDRALIGVVSAEYKRYDYQQGLGGDFTETFDNGKYNKANMSFAYRVEDLQNYMYADKENGRLTIDNVGYTGVISTKQPYGDFEFTFEIAKLNTTVLDDGTVAPCNFLFGWGRAAAESDYASGGCGLYISWGSDLNIMGPSEVTFEGNGPWVNFNVPTDKLDDKGQPMGRSATLWDYNFSEGNLVFKTIKKDHRVEVYIYTANSPADHSTRTKPICVLLNDYSFGYVGLCGVPTGRPMSMQLDSFSIKNLDEHKADNLIVGTDADVVDLDFTAEADEDAPDPFEKEDSSKNSSSNSSSAAQNCNNCKTSVEVPLTVLFALGGVSLIIISARKRKADKE